MKELYRLQNELNEKIFSKRGLGDWEKLCIEGSDEDLSQWIENMRKAFSSEFAELLEELISETPDRRNIAVEIIDMMHFLISLSQLTGLPAEEAQGSLEWGCTKTFGPENSRLFPAIFLTLNGIQNAVKWKWWADGGGLKKEEASRSVYSMWFGMGRLLATFTDLDFEGAKRVFQAKMKVNHARQDNGYNEDTKTEDDNKTIEVRA
jgi:dimeric dUTPase (all-alpha-NTP-PPase superfamily)